MHFNQSASSRCSLAPQKPVIEISWNTTHLSRFSWTADPNHNQASRTPSTLLNFLTGASVHPKCPDAPSFHSNILENPPPPPSLNSLEPLAMHKRFPETSYRSEFKLLWAPPPPSGKQLLKPSRLICSMHGGHLSSTGQFDCWSQSYVIPVSPNATVPYSLTVGPSPRLIPSSLCQGQIVLPYNDSFRAWLVKMG